MYFNSDIACSYSHLYYLSIGNLPSIRVHWRHDVDASVVNQLSHVGVTCLVGLTHVVRQLQQHLAPHHLIAMHIAHILELRLTWKWSPVHQLAESQGKQHMSEQSNINCHWWIFHALISRLIESQITMGSNSWLVEGSEALKCTAIISLENSEKETKHFDFG